jgi:hypothetical protein
MQTLAAIRLMVKHMEGGWDTAGRLCGKSAETMRHAWGGKDTRYVPSQIDAEILSEYCITHGTAHCHAYAEAVAAASGGFVKLQVRDTMAPQPQDVIRDFAKVVAEASDVLDSGISGLADGHVSENDYAHSCTQLRELREAMQKAQQDLDAAYEAGKRGPLQRVR